MRKQVFVCSECNHFIFEGDDVFDYLGEQLCRKCVKKHTRKAVKTDESDRGQLLRPRS